MTAEIFAPEPSKAVELYVPQHREQAVTEIGKLSIEGFTIMEPIESSWQDVREKLDVRIIGQPAAIDAIIEVLEASHVRPESDKRPVATLAFLGPTGVGKSETAKSLAEFIDCNKKFVKIDCSDYSHGHEVASLIGAPVGYIGFGQEPLLSKERVEGYGTVVLFDEIEKGSEQLYNLMLQIMEDGELQLKNGKVTSFKEAIVILTSNLGAKEMAGQLSNTPLGFGGLKKDTSMNRLDEVAISSFKEFFRPEFVNRLSKMVVFHPLGAEQLGEVLDSKLDATNVQFEEELGARLSLSTATRSYLVDIAAKEPSMGARPLVRALDEHIYATFGRFYGSEAVPEGTHIKVFHRSELGLHVVADDSELVFMSKPDPTIRKASPAPELVAGTEDDEASCDSSATEMEHEPEDPDDPEPTEE